MNRISLPVFRFVRSGPDLFLLPLLLLTSQLSLAQNPTALPVAPTQGVNQGAPMPLRAWEHSTRSTDCSVDILIYPFNKNGNNSPNAIFLGDSSNALLSAALYYEAPQPVTVHAFGFYANSFTLDSIQIRCELYLAGTDSFPLGGPLAAKNVWVKRIMPFTNIGQGLYEAEFAQPITVTGPYMLVLTNLNSDLIVVYGSNINNGAGGGEWLTRLRNQTGWRHPSSIFFNTGMGTLPYNADLYFLPKVDYSLHTTLSGDTTCTLQPDSSFFQGNSSPVVNNRFYNSFVANGTPEQAWVWNMNGTFVLGQNIGHVFTQKGDQEVLLTTRVGWQRICQDTVQVEVGGLVDGQIQADIMGQSVNFSTNSTNASSWRWYFGDGDSSHLPNPTHLYPNIDSFEVTLILSSDCDQDTLTQMIVLCALPQGNFTWDQPDLNQYEVQFADQTAGATSWQWDFGDGAFSTLQSPNHFYTNAGQYEVSLVVGNGCGHDTIKQNVDLWTVGLTPEWAQSLRLYPQPMQDILWLDGINGLAPDARLQLLNLQGQVLQEHSLEPGLRRHRIDLRGIPNGMYLIRIESKQQQVIRKFLRR